MFVDFLREKTLDEVFGAELERISDIFWLAILARRSYHQKLA
jgi:hypothetical protein